MAEVAIISMDMPNRACMPFAIPANFPVLGDNLQFWQPGMLGSEKILDSYRYTTFAAVGVQAAATTDNITIAAGNINLLGAGAGLGTTQGGAGTLLGYPAAFGAIGYNRSNFYPGGLLCQIGLQFVIVAMSARPKQLFTAPAGVITKGPWTLSYQAQAQQLMLDNSVFTFTQNLQTCSILGNSLAHYPTNFSSGAPQSSSQNGEPIRGNVMPLCAGLPVGAAQGTPVNGSPDSTLNVSWPAMVLEVDLFNQPPAQLTAATPLIIETEVIFFGFCRGYCPPSYCPPGGYSQIPRTTLGPAGQLPPP